MIPSGVILLMLCGCLFAGLMSNRANDYQPAAMYAGCLVVAILGWSAIAFIGAGVGQLLQAVMG